MQNNFINLFKFTLAILFIIFLTLFFSGITGVYEYENKQKMLLTNEQIKKFEEDIKNGVEIDMEKYITNNSKNYQNFFSNLGSTLSNTVSNFISSAVSKSFDTLTKFIEQWKIYFNLIKYMIKLL